MIAASGHGWGLAVFPLGAAIIATVFGARLLTRYAKRRRPYEGVWAVALLMYAAASFAMFLGVVRGWTPADYRVYWLLGAVLNVPYLFAGEVFLLTGRAVARGFLILLVAATAIAVPVVSNADLRPGALANRLPLGKDVFLRATPYRLAQFYSIPAYFLLLGALVWSVWKMRGRPELRDRAVGTFAIAMGATLVAIGSGIGAAFHVVPLFSVSLAAGVAVMFAGFLRAGRRRQPAR
jgi:hypothetical protein